MKRRGEVRVIPIRARARTHTHTNTYMYDIYTYIHTYIHTALVNFKKALIRKHLKAFLKFTSAIQTDKLTKPEPNGD